MKTATLYVTTTSGEFDLCLHERPARNDGGYTPDLDALVKVAIAKLYNDFKGSGIEIIDIVRVDGSETGGAL